jgi:hypothetical protein
MCILVRTIPSTDETEIDERCRHSRFLYELPYGALRFTVNGISTQLPWSPISGFLDREDKTNFVPCVLFHSF